MTRRPLLLAALALPALWLAAGIWHNERALSAAPEWRIPIEGYDPRDPLRGRYIQFAYAWQLSGDAALCTDPAQCRLCLGKAGGTVVATIAPAPAACAHPVDLQASAIDMRRGFGPRAETRFTSRIFVSETSAPLLEAQLREGPMEVVAAVTPDGRLVNLRLQPRGQPAG